MTTKTILGLAAASLFALAPAVHAEGVQSKSPVISTQGPDFANLTPDQIALIIAGGAGAGLILSGGKSNGSSSTTTTTTSTTN